MEAHVLRYFRLLHIPTATYESYIYTKNRLTSNDKPVYILVSGMFFSFVSNECYGSILAHKHEFEIVDYTEPLTKSQELSLNILGICYMGPEND